jgi:hypothetical protein
MENLVYAELMGRLTMEMMMDNRLLILGDTGLFIITFEDNAVNYPNETFYEVCEEAIRDYEIVVKNGRIISNANSRTDF